MIYVVIYKNGKVHAKREQEGGLKMKKVLYSIILMIVMLMTASTGFVYATNSQNELASTNVQGELKEFKEKSSREMQDYVSRYGSQTYGMTAYILDKIRIYSIPFCFIGIAVGAIYQYVIGIRKLDVRDRGFGVVIAFVTVLVICQVLPLIFAIVVKGWRG